MGAAGTGQDDSLESDQPGLAGACSGPFDYITEAIVGKPGSSRSEFTLSEDGKVPVLGESRDVDAISYFGCVYRAESQDKLKAVPVVNPASGQPVLPALEFVTVNKRQPLFRPIFIYVNAAGQGRLQARPDTFTKTRTGTAFGGAAEAGECDGFGTAQAQTEGMGSVRNQLPQDVLLSGRRDFQQSLE